MCHAIDLDPCDVWTETQRTARKQHVCSSCKTTIEPGQQYHTHFSVFEGEAETQKICQTCFADRETFCKAHGGQLMTPQYFPHLLAECIADGDEESETTWRPILDRIQASRQAWDAARLEADIV